MKYSTVITLNSKKLSQQALPLIVEKGFYVYEKKSYLGFDMNEYKAADVELKTKKFPHSPKSEILKIKCQVPVK